MLQITVPEMELWDEVNEILIDEKEQTLQLEHSLISIARWESKWNKAFLSKREKTFEETLDYIRCMTINPKVDPSVYRRLSSDNIEMINQYIDAPMTATYILDEEDGGSGSRDVITAELIYYWMISYNIPFECQKWHLNRLLTLIKVCNVKTAAANPSHRKRKGVNLKNRARMNAERRARANSKG